jgi:hypothetical protein
LLLSRTPLKVVLEKLGHVSTAVTADLCTLFA